jgi:general secretion pathway protein I
MNPVKPKSSIGGHLGAKMPRDARGFSLLEILVAFIVLALAMTILMQIFSTSLNGATITDKYARATMIAESKLAAVGVEEILKEGGSSGSTDDGFSWAVEVRPYVEAITDPNPANNPASYEQLLYVKLFEVVLSVSFDADDKKKRTVTLSKLQVGPRQTQ